MQKNGGINIDYHCNIAFTKVTTTNNEIEKDIANVYATISADKNTITAQITNAYPGYKAQITYTIRNTGNRPIQFTSLTIATPNPEALEITTTNLSGTWLNPCETTSDTTTIPHTPNSKRRPTIHIPIKKPQNTSRKATHAQ